MVNKEAGSILVKKQAAQRILCSHRERAEGSGNSAHQGRRRARMAATIRASRVWRGVASGRTFQDFLMHVGRP